MKRHPPAAKSAENGEYRRNPREPAIGVFLRKVPLLDEIERSPVGPQRIKRHQEQSGDDEAPDAAVAQEFSNARLRFLVNNRLGGNPFRCEQPNGHPYQPERATNEECGSPSVRRRDRGDNQRRCHQPQTDPHLVERGAERQFARRKINRIGFSETGNAGSLSDAQRRARRDQTRDAPRESRRRAGDRPYQHRDRHAGV